MQRRGFVKMCATAVAGVTASPQLLGEGAEQYHRYARSALVDPHTSEPVSAASLEVGETYLFHYPYISTPCFLIDLGKTVPGNSNLKTSEGRHYRWQGGVGARRSIVAFSAICAHKMTHPAKSVSFINYRHEPVRFRNSDDRIEERSGVIYCCSESSVYDPASGCRVLGGPAPQPLAAIELEHDPATDALYATGTIGGEMFASYFRKFHDRLVLEHGRTDIDSALADTTVLMRLSEFTANEISCQV